MRAGGPSHGHTVSHGHVAAWALRALGARPWEGCQVGAGTAGQLPGFRGAVAVPPPGGPRELV